jgi:hypothetical protein
MEVLFNFEKKELVIKSDANFLEVYRRIKKFIGKKDLENWSIVSETVYWHYPVYPTYPWPQTRAAEGTGEAPATSIYALTDDLESLGTIDVTIEGSDVVTVLDRTEDYMECK